MKHVVLWVAVAVALWGCSSADERALEQARVDVIEAGGILDRDKGLVRDAQMDIERYQADLANGEWDIAADANADKIVPSQVADIKASLGKDWRSVYRDRAERAKLAEVSDRQLADRAVQQADLYRKAVAEDQKRVDDLNRRIAELEAMVKR